MKTGFFCESCGYFSAKWLGKCPECAEWNSFVENKSVKDTGNPRATFSTFSSPLPITSVEVTPQNRRRVGINEFDRNLGGGIVPGSVILLCGDPGVGKSTLILQVCQCLAVKGWKILYVSGEESVYQIKDRAIRINTDSKNIFLISETRLETIEEYIRKIEPQLFILDSIQTTYTSQIQGLPGNISQVREVASRLMIQAKNSNISTFIIGHVTKDGSIAGPRVLEHIVDTVLYLEGEKYHTYRILRTVKNRFGPTKEIGVFEIKEKGLFEVLNPSALFLTEHTVEVSGSVVVSCLEGSRPLLSELQALVSKGSAGFARRTAVGVDAQRVSLLLAVLEKRIGICLQDQDVYINVVGGLKLNEPAVDLGIVLSIISSYWEKPINKNIVLMGEVGLSGEVRGVSQTELRIQEALKLGFDLCILPVRSMKTLPAEAKKNCYGVQSLKEVVEFVFS